LQYVSRINNTTSDNATSLNFEQNFDRSGIALHTPQLSSQIRMASTGSCFSAASMTTAVLLLALSAPTGVASGLDFARTSQRLSQIPYYDIVSTVGEVAAASFPSRIRLIQKVLAVSISDLASVLGVSRQAVYKWLSDGPVSDLNREKFEDLAAAANVLAPYAISQSLMLNRRRNIAGLSLVESLRSGASAQVWAEEVSKQLIQGQNQRKMMSQILASHNRSLPGLREMGVPILDEQDD
jgi:transcriptional regulator with XRE-family HTH domain